MSQRFVSGFSVAVAAALLVGCSSSPSRDEAKPSAAKSTEVVPDTTKKPVEKSSNAKAPDPKQVNTKQEVSATAVLPTEQAGPPPIPPEATQKFENAVVLLSAGDLVRAEPELRRIADAYPEYSGALANLGILYLKAGKLPEAEKALRSATERSPQNAMAFNQLGIAYRRMGRFKDADAAYSRALAVDPNYALAHLNLGVLCDLYLQQPARALAAFERYSALSTKPDARVASWMKELQGRVKSQRPAETANP